jgi:hypothetical protein
MAKVRILVQPTGCINGENWPAVGETITIPEAVAESMVAAGHVERIGKPETEKRPAAKAKVETRKP